MSAAVAVSLNSWALPNIMYCSAHTKAWPSTSNVQRYDCENGDASVKNNVYIVFI